VNCKKGTSLIILSVMSPFSFLEIHTMRLHVFCTALLLTALTAASMPTAWASEATHSGAVYVVGIGPGDPELITLKAARVLKEADCIFCFPHLKEQVARLVPAEKIRVASPLLIGRFRGLGDRDLPPELRGLAHRSKEETAAFPSRIRELVSSGKTVVLATAGDPALFCPWSWVSQDFADLRPTVIPGVGSFNAASAALRLGGNKESGSVLLSAGDNLGTPDQHGRLKMMLVLFTHLHGLNDLLPQLQSRYPADTPIAIVSDASFPQQRVVHATLGTIQDKLGNKELPELYLIYVGDDLTPPKTPDNPPVADHDAEPTTTPLAF
jgi:precorrin-4/cobalt-precorrin-4 C11-methyltransferase